MKDEENKGVRVGENPDFDAWFFSFFLKNHIDPFAYPTTVGSREQIEFMVYPENGERYYPCSDKMFDSIMSRQYLPSLKGHYEQVFNKLICMIDELIDSPYDNQFLKALIKIKYDDEIRTGLLIPSRLEKRLYQIFSSRTHIENPYSAEKRAANKKIQKFLDSETFKKALNQINGTLVTPKDLSLFALRERIKEIEFQRRLTLMAKDSLWTHKNTKLPSLSQIKEIFKTPIKGNGLPQLLELMKAQSQKILWLADESGEVVADLKIAKFLADLGHIVIFAVKEAPFFKKVCLADTRTDPVLVKEFENAHFIHEKTISKNNLVKLLKHDKHLYVVSDGTRENINLLLTSTTFSRIFKEVDCVISRGVAQKKRLIDSHFQFTQDIINIRLEKKALWVTYKPRHPHFIKFSHEQLEEMANKIIDQMKTAKKKGMTVMFYSGIIGSIPGKIDVAKRIMQTFIEYLHQQSTDLFIINPSHYYEPGMDADDLMFMWEIVQRSRYIDIWRFQTSDDIAESFSLLNKKVPPEWIGKDSTYSTGCTKEIRIAQEVQRENPEMQLIGPSLDKFMRRNEYGVGSMYDQRLAAS
ncbi:ARMT1-like domain-containing protein [Desulfobacula sp.]|uniref:ARMT1-like domain-containing protein n=1 Tax=Desulfobacula sp. TaxID=2593537 RepID=UPI00261E263D|nr:ARMT1-like domain-containing protein [Desulfobacula sp.]